MKANQLISVIMNCYNSVEYLELSLSSVLQQTYTNFEIIFIDNHSSTPEVSRIVHSYKSEKITYKYLDKLVPLGNARNIGILEAKGDYICFLDCDDLWESNRLEAMISFAQINNVEFLTSETQSITSTGEKKNVYHVFEKNKYDFVSVIKHFNILILSVLIKRDLLLQNNIFFDPYLQLLEDYDFFLRLYKVVPPFYFAKVLNYYRHHSAMTSISKEELFHFEFKYLANKYVISNFFILPQDNLLYKTLVFKADYCMYRKLLRENHRFSAFKCIKKYTFNGFTYLGLTIMSFLGFSFFSKMYYLINKREQF